MKMRRVRGKQAQTLILSAALGGKGCIHLALSQVESGKQMTNQGHDLHPYWRNCRLNRHAAHVLLQN